MLGHELLRRISLRRDAVYSLETLLTSTFSLSFLTCSLLPKTPISFSLLFFSFLFSIQTEHGASWGVIGGSGGICRSAHISMRPSSGLQKGEHVISIVYLTVSYHSVPYHHISYRTVGLRGRNLHCTEKGLAVIVMLMRGTCMYLVSIDGCTIA